MNVNVLGTKYDVIFETLAENKRLGECDGYIEWYAKEIHVRKHTPEENTESRAKCLNVYEQKVLRHELIHAFLYESGLHINTNDIRQWAVNEEMIDWIAIQMPKIMAAYDSIVGLKAPNIDGSVIIEIDGDEIEEAIRNKIDKILERASADLK